MIPDVMFEVKFYINFRYICLYLYKSAFDHLSNCLYSTSEELS